jgi:hypothetical protein
MITYNDKLANLTKAEKALKAYIKANGIKEQVTSFGAKIGYSAMSYAQSKAGDNASQKDITKSLIDTQPIWTKFTELQGAVELCKARLAGDDYPEPKRIDIKGLYAQAIEDSADRKEEIEYQSELLEMKNQLIWTGMTLSNGVAREEAKVERGQVLAQLPVIFKTILYSSSQEQHHYWMQKWASRDATKWYAEKLAETGTHVYGRSSLDTILGEMWERYAVKEATLGMDNSQRVLAFICLSNFAGTDSGAFKGTKSTAVMKRKQLTAHRAGYIFKKPLSEKETKFNDCFATAWKLTAGIADKAERKSEIRALMTVALPEVYVKKTSVAKVKKVRVAKVKAAIESVEDMSLTELMSKVEAILA